MIDKWTRRWLNEALRKAEWSKDPSRKIGAVAVGKHKQLIATGYNGFPRGIRDTPDRYNDRQTKYKYVVHAEMNLIYNACLTGISLEGATLYVCNLPVCSECAKGIIQVGIKEVVAVYDDKMLGDWKASGQLTQELFIEAGVIYKQYTMEDLNENIS